MEVQDGEDEYIPSYSRLLMASVDLWVMKEKYCNADCWKQLKSQL